VTETVLALRHSSSQVLFFGRASYSCCIAENQSEFSSACFTVLGSEWTRNNEGWSLELWIPDLDLVCLGWVLTGAGLATGIDSEYGRPDVVNYEVWEC